MFSHKWASSSSSSTMSLWYYDSSIGDIVTHSLTTTEKHRHGRNVTGAEVLQCRLYRTLSYLVEHQQTAWNKVVCKKLGSCPKVLSLQKTLLHHLLLRIIILPSIFLIYNPVLINTQRICFIKDYHRWQVYWKVPFNQTLAGPSSAQRRRRRILSHGV